MAVVIDGYSAAVHFDLMGDQRLKSFLLAGKRVVNGYAHGVGRSWEMKDRLGAR